MHGEGLSNKIRRASLGQLISKFSFVYIYFVNVGHGAGDAPEPAAVDGTHGGGALVGVGEESATYHLCRKIRFTDSLQLSLEQCLFTSSGGAVT